MAENFDKNIKQAKIYKEALDASNKSIERQDSAMKSLSDTMGIAYSSFITQIEKTNEQRREESRLVEQSKRKIEEQTSSMGNLVDKTYGITDALKSSISQTDLFSKSLKSINLGNLAKDFTNIEGIQTRIDELSKNRDKLNTKELADLDKLTSFKDDYWKKSSEFSDTSDKDLAMYISSNEDLQKILILQGVALDDTLAVRRALTNMTKGEASMMDTIITADIEHTELQSSLADSADRRIESEANYIKLQKEASNEMINQRGLMQNFLNIVEKNSKNAFKAISENMRGVNQSFKDGQKDFGLIFDKGNYAQMANLTSEAARFGMSVGDTVNMMGQLGDELKTTDTVYLASAAEHFIAIQKATGISSQEVTTIAGEMMRAGKSAEEVEGFMDSSNKISKQFGVNTKKVLQGVSKNIDKMRTMGFEGGEESLTRMAARAERLNMNMDEMFDVAKRARSIEGSMEMASQLQLAGGSFANINPMDLLAAARKGPEELQKILTEMGGDIGKFNKDTGKLDFDAVDADRLQMVADATGQTVDSIQKGLQKAAADNSKIDILGLNSSIGEDEKAFLADMTSMKGKQLTMSPELEDLASGAGIKIGNIKDLKNLSQDDMKLLMEEKKQKTESLEEQALANQSFDESITAFKGVVMNLFTIFQPVLDVFTDIVQGITKFGWFGQLLAASLIGFIAFGPKIIGGFQSFRDSATSIASGFKGFLGGIKNGEGFLGKLKGGLKGGFGKDEGGLERKDSAPKGGGGGLKTLAEGLKAMGNKDVLRGIAYTALSAPALILMLPAIPTLLLMAGVGALGKLVEAGFKAVANGVSAVGEAKGVMKGALAMVVVGASLIPFAFALQMMSDVGWDTILKSIVMMGVGVAALMVVGALVTGPGGVALLMGALALVAVGIALMTFGASLMIFAAASQMMQGLSFGWLGDLGYNLLIASPGLLLGGLALLAAAPGLLIGSLGLLAIANIAQAVTAIDWSAFSAMGNALLSVVPGLLGFSLAGLMFANPITMIGMLMMMGTLSGLTLIMVPLASALEIAANSIDRFAEGLEKLQAVAANLDFERLEALKDLSMSMAVGSSGGGLGESINKIAEALANLSSAGKGGEGKGGTQKFEINLKLNGRHLQTILTKDCDIIS